jgi:periplasmic mercuric ion binding protein
MKTVKTLFVIAFVISMTSAAKAQQFNYKLDGPWMATKTFKVSGVCVMCEQRIENAIKNLPGIWFSHWDINSYSLQVTYDRLKLNPDKIEQQIAKAGHDSGKFRAQDQVYLKLPDCCHYQRKS